MYRRQLLIRRTYALTETSLRLLRRRSETLGEARVMSPRGSRTGVRRADPELDLLRCVVPGASNPVVHDEAAEEVYATL